MPKPPAPPPEARLLKLARLRRNNTSITEAAALAGVSVSLWRQVETGYSTPAAGVRVPKIAPADTLAVMSRPLGITPAELTKAGREDAAAILAELAAPETAAPEPPRETPAADDVTHNIMVAAGRPEERRIWAAIRERLEATPAGAALFADPAQAAFWPPETGDGHWGGAPGELTPEAVRVLDSIPVDVLFSHPIDRTAARLERYPWPDRIGMAAAMRGRIGLPTQAARRAG